jgi:membrane protein YqaA with SNARE-associated domain
MKELTKENKVQLAFSTIGFAAGIYLAYANKKGAWAYIGYAIGLSIVGSVIGYGVGTVVFTPTVKKQNV